MGTNWFIIGGGWSVSQYDLRDLSSFGKVIGINDAALWTPGCHTALTMDRLWFEHRWPYLRTLRVPEVFVREKCDCNIVRKDKARDNWKTFTHLNKPGLSVDEGTLYGGNSGVCGINLAFQRSEEGDMLFLLGFDMCKGPKGDPYWYPPYPWAKPEGATMPRKYKEWAPEFEAIGNQIRAAGRSVFNVTTYSEIDEYAVPKMTWDHMWEIID